MENLGRVFVSLGILFILFGLLFSLGGRFLSIGRLPGDIVIKRDNFTFYFPLMTSVLLSIVLSGAFWLLSLFKR